MKTRMNLKFKYHYHRQKIKEKKKNTSPENSSNTNIDRISRNKVLVNFRFKFFKKINGVYDHITVKNKTIIMTSHFSTQ